MRWFVTVFGETEMSRSFTSYRAGGSVKALAYPTYGTDGRLVNRHAGSPVYPVLTGTCAAGLAAAARHRLVRSTPSQL
jgi:hypothetical protein